MKKFHFFSPHAIAKLARTALLLCFPLSLLMAVSIAPRTVDASSETVTLNFVNAEISEVARAIAIMTGRNIVVDPRVKGNVTIASEKPVSTSEAYDQFLVAVRTQGYSIAETDGIFRLVPEADARLLSSTLLDKHGSAKEGGATHLRGSQIATQVFPLNFENATTMATLLRPLMGPASTIATNQGNNSIIITDYADNLRRAAKIIASQDVAKGTDLEIIPLRNASATELAPLVSKLIEGTGGAPGAGAAPLIMADVRSNSLIVRAANPLQLGQIRSLATKLDREDSSAETSDAVTPGVYVIKLKNAEAAKLAATLRTALPGNINPTGAATPSNVQVQADATTNSLIITAPYVQYKQLRAVIEKLDARPAQVFVESLIAEVNTDRAAEFGIQWQTALGAKGDGTVGVIGTNYDSGSPNNIFTLSQGKKTDGTYPLPGAGLNLGIFRRSAGVYILGFLARFLESSGEGNILATPNVLTMDNEESKVIVGQNVPFLTGQYTNNGNGGNPFQTIERKDVGLTLRVKPQISENGTIKMKIFQEISAVVPNSIGNASGITTNKRSIETNVVVDDGAIVVLGGLLQEEYADTQTKIPFLGDVPVLGNLFKNNSRTRKKLNLMVFIRPMIVRTEEQSSHLSAARYDSMREEQTKQQRPRSAVLPNDPVPRVPERADKNPAAMNMTPSLPEGSLRMSNSVVTSRPVQNKGEIEAGAFNDLFRDGDKKK